jgi:hypothetical protein
LLRLSSSQVDPKQKSLSRRGIQVKRRSQDAPAFAKANDVARLTSTERPVLFDPKGVRRPQPSLDPFAVT